MDTKIDINEYIQSLKMSPRMADQVVYHTLIPGSPPAFGKPEKPWPETLEKILKASGISNLYTHQALAVDMIRSGKHVMVATPTASGKTMIYNLPVLENIINNPESKALYLFPLKALAQDQLRSFQTLVSYSDRINAGSAIYDGDTSAWHRKKIRNNLPNVIMTNPDMLHLSFLAYHQKWADFFSNLDIVVVDEVHTYRGVMGSHMAQVFRRFIRICNLYGAYPVFVFCSATIGNPGELTRDLTGLDVIVITESGAGQGKKHLIFMDSIQGPAQTAILLLKAALHRRLRTIVYSQSRKMTELIAIWAGSRSGKYSHLISSYRAGFLPEERREIESRLSHGDLLAVISTSALELGIDIGDLDLCLLVGYPGTIVATWQRAGRVGRSGQDSALILIAGEDALDQYFMRNPLELISREPESAVVNPYNLEILKKHLVCAASEYPLQKGEPYIENKEVIQAIAFLEKKAILLRSGDGMEIYAARKAPHRDVDIRGTGTRFNIICEATGKNMGDIDGFRAFRETHPGAIYIHNGEKFLVKTLDSGAMTIKVIPVQVSYYTRVRTDKETEILEIFQEKNVWGTRVFTGRLKVTDQVTGYEKWLIHGKKRINVIPLNLPPQVFETEGIWFKIPVEIQKEAEDNYLHFMGGIHAVEHAAIGIFPLLVITDRNDLGGISTPFHPQTGSAAVFIYDGVPGGAGLSRQAFIKAETLLEVTLKAISSCTCETGCPSCVHSPKCGSGNRPIDKGAAVFILDRIMNNKTGVKHKRNICSENKYSVKSASESVPKLVQTLHFGVLDIETRISAQEAGGWHRADRMGISCAVLYDFGTDTYYEFTQDETPSLIRHMKKLDLVVGFNIKKFDYKVLMGQSDFDFNTIPTLDILEEIYKRLNYRLSLDHVAGITLGAKKSGNGLQALEWWKQGRIREIIDYCRRDVEITRDLYLFGREKKYILFKNKAKNIVRIPVDW